MSDYERNKALRLPLEKYGYEEDPHKIESENPAAFNRRYGVDEKFFEVVGTDNGKHYLDYVLESDYGADAGDFSKSRALSKREKYKYLGTFQQLIPNVNMDDVRLVEYCWYNCSEPMDIYNETTDPFYEEV